MRNLLVNTSNGPIVGVEEDCIVFKGIPYAKAPIGENRFRAPQKLERREEVYQADHFPNRSMQVSWDAPDGFFKKEFYMDSSYETPMSEDSLYLNIWTPRIGKEHRMPVMFYIHGGGFLGGYGHEMEFCTSEYAKRDVVLVTINYRVGIFGFLSHQWLTQDDPKASGNYAILDQIAALGWVKENIEAFGGDPDNITICGQSAGAMSVETLLASPMTEGMFAHAIVQSASGYPNYIADVKSLDDAEKMGQKAMEYAGVQSLEELRTISAEKLLEAQSRLVIDAMEDGCDLPYGPVVNGYVLKESVMKAIENGNLHKVPIMIGSTMNDITVTEEELKSGTSRMHESNVNFSLKCEETQQNPSYVYYFKRNLPGDEAGAFHSSELWYTFGTLARCWRPMTEADYKLSHCMMNNWAAFAKSGDPNIDGSKKWKICCNQHAYVEIFDI